MLGGQRLLRQESRGRQNMVAAGYQHASSQGWIWSGNTVCWPRLAKP